MTEDMVLQALCGLVQDYESFLTSLTTQSILLTFSSLRTKLLSYEQRIQQFNLSVENRRPSSQIVAVGTSKARVKTAAHAMTSPKIRDVVLLMLLYHLRPINNLKVAHLLNPLLLFPNLV